MLAISFPQTRFTTHNWSPNRLCSPQYYKLNREEAENPLNDNFPEKYLVSLHFSSIKKWFLLIPTFSNVEREKRVVKYLYSIIISLLAVRAYGRANPK